MRNRLAKLHWTRVLGGALGGTAPFTPDSISGLVAWWDFSDVDTLYQDSAKTTAVASDGDPIGACENKANVGTYDAIQGTSSAKPTYKTGIQNGLSTSSYDGGDLLTADALGDVFDGDDVPFTLVVVSVLDNPNAAARRLWSFGNSADGANYRSFYHLKSATNFQWGSQGADAGVDIEVYSENDTNFVVWDLVVNGATLDGYRNGSQTLTGGDINTGTMTLDQFTLGVLRRNTNIQFWLGDIGEVFLYDSALSSGDLASLQEWVNDKWAVY